MPIIRLKGELHPEIKVLGLKEGDTVLDPFFGSGSLGEACIKSNRNFIGIEKNGLYYKNAVERLTNVQNYVQQSLFNGA